jgi:hypothetical protein
VEGVTIPAFIHNGHYFLIDLPVYEDGSVDCWERIALDDVAEKIEEGWLLPSVPDGESIDIHDLGCYPVKSAEWTHDGEGFLAHIVETARRQNARMDGLYRETAEQKAKWKKRRLSWTTRAVPYEVKGDFGYELVPGESAQAFLRAGEDWRLVNVAGFADGAFSLDGRDHLTADEISSLFGKEQLTSVLPVRAKVIIDGLGVVVFGEAAWKVETGEKLKEILDLPNRIKDGKSAADLCRRAYHDYLECPTEPRRERLRTAYEAVPEHERMYLGDMDAKDSDYWRILHESERKREV